MNYRRFRDTFLIVLRRCEKNLTDKVIFSKIEGYFYHREVPQSLVKCRDFKIEKRIDFRSRMMLR